MARATIRGLNQAMKAEGIDAEIVKGEGYFYFTNHLMPSIYIYALNHCTHDEWMEHIRSSWEWVKP